MKIIKEDLEVVVPNIVDAIDITEITPEGPAQGLDTAIADLILNSINTSTQKLQEYNTLNANLGNYEDLREILTEIMADENAILGKLQTMLKVVSPNATEIMHGAVEAEQQLSESLLLEEYGYNIEDEDDLFFALLKLLEGKLHEMGATNSHETYNFAYEAAESYFKFASIDDWFKYELQYNSDALADLGIDTDNINEEE